MIEAKNKKVCIFFTQRMDNLFFQLLTVQIHNTNMGRLYSWKIKILCMKTNAPHINAPKIYNKNVLSQKSVDMQKVYCRTKLECVQQSMQQIV